PRRSPRLRSIWHRSFAPVLVPRALDRRPITDQGRLMEPRQRPLLALGVRLVGAMALATMLMMVKLASERGLALPEAIFWRQLVPTLLIYGWLAVRGRTGSLATRRFPVHLMRAVTGLAGMYLNLGVVLLLPLAEATTLAFTAPIFAVILAAFF